MIILHLAHMAHICNIWLRHAAPALWSVTLVPARNCQEPGIRSPTQRRESREFRVPTQFRLFHFETRNISFSGHDRRCLTATYCNILNIIRLLRLHHDVRDIKWYHIVESVTPAGARSRILQLLSKPLYWAIDSHHLNNFSKSLRLPSGYD